MKIVTRKNLQDFSLPLPVFDSVHVADAIGMDGEEFEIFVGMSEKCTLRLKRLSLDESDISLQKGTGDRNRFGEGSYKEWYGKNRTPFCLIHKRTDALAAFVWFGPKPLGEKSIRFGSNVEKIEQPVAEENWHTISCRSYPPFRGKGLMKNFTQFVMDIYKKNFPGAMFWSGTDNRNTAMVKLGSELGFEISGNDSDLSENWLVMVKK